jgi:hypothetical protein
MFLYLIPKRNALPANIRWYRAAYLLKGAINQIFYSFIQQIKNLRGNLKCRKVSQIFNHVSRR